MIDLRTKNLINNNTNKESIMDRIKNIGGYVYGTGLFLIVLLGGAAVYFFFFSFVGAALSADGWVYDQHSRTIMTARESGGVHATFKIMTNAQQTKAFLVYQPTPQAGAAPMVVKEIDTQVDESARWGYEVIALRNAYDGGAAIVIDQDFIDEAMSASDLMIIVYPQGSAPITYWMPLSGFSEAAGQMPSLARAVQGENRVQ